MANNKMLIDASHPEETRVVVLRGNRIEEFDFESASKKPLRGNIYLAKVTRVEPSLQAAFIEYGGNRHGFLAFPEIHPDYYQIPVADRQALLEEDARERSEEETEQEERRPQRRNQRRRRPDDRARRRRNGDAVLTSADGPEGGNEDEANTGLQTEALTQDTQPQEISSQEVPSQEILAEGQEISGQESSPQEVTAQESLEQRSLVQEAPAQVTSGRGDEAGPEDGGTRPAAKAELASPAPAVEAQTAAPGDGQDTSQQESAPQDLAPEFQSRAAKPEEARFDESGSISELESRAIPEQDPDQDTGEEPDAGEDRDDARDDSDEDSDDDESGEDESGDDEAGEDDEEIVEQLGGDAEEDMPRPVRRSRRQYKIQEVIKRRQVMLVQVVKEERGNKGAALTTYLSLAGRYSVLMPNTARGGGISRKITDGDDRRRLKEIVQELDVPDGMGVILRTAGASRPMDDVRRDFEYLLRMWESVRELTLRSTAPTLVYEEGSLIKRSIRDLYGKDVDEVIVSGDGGYAEARDYMRMLLPNQVKNVRHWREPQPLFAKSGVETQLDSMFTNVVTLRSGGYIVINQTEALVAIDVNSGRSTREHNIEDTALRTNMEAADEVARQLRLRDLAGLIVVDFIDMDEHRNNRAVERRMKDALKSDRARIQVGRISHFGLLEMSRQRMRPGMLEGSSVVCPHCMGAGTVRSTASIALHVLRLVEDSLVRTNAYNLIVRTRAAVALYILNQKRAHVYDLEQRFGVGLFVEADETLTGSVYHAIERGEAATAPAAISAKSQQIRIDSISPWQDDESESEDTADLAIAAPLAVIEQDDDLNGDDDDTIGAGADADDEGDQRRKRRRRRRRGREREESTIDPAAPQPSDDGLAIVASLTRDIPQVSEDAGPVTASGEENEPVSGEGDDERGARRGRRRRRPRRGERDLESGEASGEQEVNAEGMSGRAKDAPQDSELAPTAPMQSGEPAIIAPVEPSYQNGGWTFTPSAPAPAAEPSMTTQAEAPQPATGMQEAPALELQPSEPALREPAAQEPAAQELSALETKQAQKDQAQQDEIEKAETARRAALEMLPEAPAPEQKKTGWWARMRNTGN